MKIEDAANLAVNLMVEHNIFQQGWRFQFDRSVKRFGVCMYRRKVIGLSKALTELNGVDKVKDTILHEIAHAIAGYKAGHGWEWREVCLRIGAKPERCYSIDEVKQPPMKYYAKCGACGKEFQKARLHKKEARRSCKCQEGKNWNDRVLIEFKARY